MRIHTCFALAISFAAIAAPSTAMAAGEATGSSAVTATVPAICDIAAEDFFLSESGAITGSVFEFCNTDTGFHISAAYRTLDTKEAITVRYGTETTALDDSGSSIVAFRWGQRLARVPVTIEARDLDAPLAVAFSLAAV